MTRTSQLPLRLPLPRARPWFWRLYALRLEREVILLRARVRALEEPAGRAGAVHS